MKLISITSLTFICVFSTEVLAVPITNDLYRYDVRNTNPWSASRMNMGERGDVLEWYGGDDTEPAYLDGDDDDDLEQDAKPNQSEELSKRFYGYPDIKRSADNYKMNHLVRFDKKALDNYRMNHLVRFVEKKSMPSYLTRQLRNDKTNVWNKILNRI